MSSSRWLARASAAPLAGLLGLVGAGLLWSAFSSPTSPVGEPSVASAVREPSVDSPGDAVRSSYPARERLQAQQEKRVEPPAGGIEDLISGPVLPESEPIEIAIPRLGVTSRLVDLGLDGAGAMEVPHDPAVAGWYTLGPSPGGLGPAVIAGHVSWNQAPAVFFRLGALRSGDRVTVAREDGNEAVFSVSRVATFDKAQFPTREVFGNIDHAGLRLITCGGRYDDTAHRYLANVVVFAVLVDVRSGKG